MKTVFRNHLSEHALVLTSEGKRFDRKVQNHRKISVSHLPIFYYLFSDIMFGLAFLFPSQSILQLLDPSSSPWASRIDCFFLFYDYWVEFSFFLFVTHLVPNAFGMKLYYSGGIIYYYFTSLTLVLLVIILFIPSLTFLVLGGLFYCLTLFFFIRFKH